MLQRVHRDVTVLTQGYIYSVNYTSPDEKKTTVAQREHLLSSFQQFQNCIGTAIQNDHT